MVEVKRRKCRIEERDSHYEKGTDQSDGGERRERNVPRKVQRAGRGLRARHIVAVVARINMAVARHNRAEGL